MIRLDRWLAALALGSRSQVQQLVRQGDVTVNGAAVRDPGRACDEAHEIQMEKIPGGIRLSVGKNMHHPMTPGHLIQWIECWIGNHTFRKHFDPGDEPVAEFMIGECCENGERPGVRLHCNVHGMRYCGSEKSTPQTTCETKTCAGQENRIPV